MKRQDDQMDSLRTFQEIQIPVYGLSGDSTPLCQNRVELIPLLTSTHRSFLLSRITDIQLILMCYRLTFITKVYALKIFNLLLSQYLLLLLYV